jgi:hypothetical protein
MYKLPLVLTVTAMLGIALFAAMSAKGADEKVADKKTRIFEMRTYTAADGKMDALHKRFREHTNGLFMKHGITIIGFWTPTEGETAKNTLVYILAYPDKAAREKDWQEFQADPDWVKAKADSEKDGKLVDKVVSVFMAPTDYSPMK